MQISFEHTELVHKLMVREIQINYIKFASEMAFASLIGKD